MTDQVGTSLYLAVSAARAACQRGVQMQIAARCAATLYAIDPAEVIKRVRNAELACEQSRAMTERHHDDETADDRIAAR